MRSHESPMAEGGPMTESLKVTEDDDAADAGLTLGVEEELHVVDLITRELVPRAPGDPGPSSTPTHFSAELHRSVVETNTPVATTPGRPAGRRSSSCRREAVDGRRVDGSGPGRGRHRAAGRPGIAPGHADLALPPDARRLSAAGPRAADLRRAGARRGARPGRGGGGGPAGRAGAAGAAGAVGQLAVLDGRGLGLRQHPLAGLAALADRRRQRPAHSTPPTTTRWSPT